jgi:ACS family hexuronate transporter-like MFS transporter
MLPMMASSLVVIAPGTTAMFAFASIAAFGYTCALSNMLALPGDAFGAELTASVWGFASVGAGLGGMLFSLITGWIVYTWSFAPAFVLFGCIPLLAAVLIISLPDSGFNGEAANRI